MTSTDPGRQADFFEALPSGLPRTITEEAEHRTESGRLTYVLDRLEQLRDERSELTTAAMFRSDDDRLWEQQLSQQHLLRGPAENWHVYDGRPDAHAIEEMAADEAPTIAVRADDRTVVIRAPQARFRTIPLFEVDPELYDEAVALRRARDAEHAAFWSERERQERAALEAAPKQVATVPTRALSTVLDALDATAGTLTITDDRIVLSLPWQVQVYPWNVDIDGLRPLLLASQCGTLDVACDLDGCEQAAQHVGIGGCFVCLTHAAP